MSGHLVKFVEDRFWWTIRAENDRFTVLTRQVAFQHKGTLLYTVIDRDRGVRGPCNLIGQGYGDGTYDDAQCAEILAAMQLHADRDVWFDAHKDDPDGENFQTIEDGPYQSRRIIWPPHLNPDDIYPIEVSYRNNIPVRIEATR